MNTLDYITKKYNLDLSLQSPIEIPNMGRNNLADLFAELKFKTGAEIGTERGLFAEVICRANPNPRLYCIDAWKAYKGYREHVTQELLDEIYEDAKKRLTHFKCKLIKAFSADAVKKFADESLDFVYIDGNHTYPFVIEDITIWSKKVRPDGIVAGHDFMTPSNNRVMQFGVVQAVREFTKSQNINHWFLIGRQAKIPGEIRDNSRSWMWIQK